MRKYYDDDDEDYEKPDHKAEPHTFLPSEHLKMIDGIIAIVLGALVFIGLSLFAFPGMCPTVWNDAAVAAGLRPPAEIFPGLWRVIAHTFYLGGVSGGNTILIWAGRACAALTAASAYMLLRALLALLVRGRLRYAVHRYTVQRVAAGLGATFFICGDSVWRSGQTFSTSGLLMLITLVQLYFFTSFLLNGRFFKAVISMFLAGWMAAETPVGFGLLILCWMVYLIALKHDAMCENMPLLDPIIGPSSKWRLTLVWALGLIGGIALNCWSFIDMQGLAAIGKVGGDMPLLYLLGWWNLILGAANGLGWTLGIGVCVLPFVLAAMMLPRSADEEQFLPYHVGAVFFFTGSLTFSQLCMLAPLWFWTWSELVEINSLYLQQLLMFCAAGTVMFSITTLGCDACCRNHIRLAMQRFAELRETNDGSHDSPVNQKRGKRGGLVILIISVTLLALGVLPGRMLTGTREMLRVVDEYAKEVVRECGDVHWIFTDGSFDARLELGSAENGGKLNALAMIQGNSPYHQYLRTRGVTDAEDRLSLSMGAPMALRSWMRDKPDRMKDAATQLGFELWKREGRELPVCSGVLARPIGMSAEDCAAGVERTTKLAESILDIYARGGLEKTAGRTIRELFLFVQWRISRLARMRAERADRAGDTQASLVDVKLSDKLDKTNESLKRILDDLERQRAMTLKQVTPRESLQLALARADFTLARRVGETILEVDADDPNANFGVGMSYVMQKQWSRAEKYLQRGLVKNPNEPAMWNNLAMVMMYQNRFDEAETHAKKALELIPESAEVKDTIKKIAEARKKAAEDKAKNENKQEK